MSDRWVPLGPVCAPNGALSVATQRRFHPVGRGVTSGRVSAIALSPDGGTIYAGAASGGVWKSTDEGATWTPTMDAEPTLAVGAIAVAPSDGRVYVGTGEANTVGGGSYVGVGILVSQDSGATWTVMPPPSPTGLDLVRTRISRIVVHPTRPLEVYAATTKGLFITDGIDFHFARPHPSFRNCTDVAVDFTDLDAPRIYAAFPDEGISIITGRPLDFSLPFAARFPFPGSPIPMALFAGVKIGDVERIALALADGRQAPLLAAFTEEHRLLGLFRSPDRGASWPPLDPKQIGTKSLASYTSLLAVDPHQPDRIFFGDTRLFRRVGAAPWHLVSKPAGIFERGSYQGMHDDHHAMAFHPTRPGVIWEGNDGGVYLSTDGGQHFFARNRGLATMQLYSVAQHPGEPAVLLGGTQDNGAVAYRGYPAWREVFGGDGFFTEIEPQSPRRWFVGYFATDDAITRLNTADVPSGDFNVVEKGLGTPGPDSITLPFVADPNVAGTLYTGQDRLYRSSGATGHGDRWNEIKETVDPATSAAINAIAVAPSDSSVVYYGRVNGAVYRLEVLAGGGFKVIKAASSLIERCQQIAVDPANPNVFFAVDGTWDGPDDGDVPVATRIWRGEHAAGAVTLTPHPSLPDVTIGAVTVRAELNHVNTIALDPSNPGVMFVGTDLGVYRGAPDPTAGGAFVWSRFSRGLPEALLVTDLQLHQPSRRLRAATMGRGVWECALDEPARDVDLYVRDTLLDYATATAAAPTSEGRQNPLTLGVLRWNDGADVRVDTETRFIGGFADPPSSVRYDGVDIDFLGFEALGNDDPRSRARSRVYVQVHNRGPGVATDVDVRLFVGKKTGNTVPGSGGYPELPANFWANAMTGAFADAPFRPAGPAQRFASVLPATPQIARFEFVASGANDTVGLLVVVSSAADPVPPALPLAVEAAVRSDKHAALKEATIAFPSFATALGVLVALGVAVAVGVAVAKDA